MAFLKLAFSPRYVALTVAILATALLFGLLLAHPARPWLIGLPLAGFAALSALGVWDVVQTKHAVLRNYPISAHLRFLLEEMRPEMRQYFFEDEKNGMPFSRDKRAVVYQRAKGQLDKRPFGTQYDVYAEGYEWIRHSLAPTRVDPAGLRIAIGGPDCRAPYDASVFNISAMSFGALSANAIRALNGGARDGRFYHDTGEGGVSPHHRENGGDLVWEIGSGYFGARDADGRFSPERFAETAADPQIKMIEVKLSQGAKPGHGGVLPAAKVTPEIAAIRGVALGRDCVSPAGHSAFSTPIGLLEFVAGLRERAGGKPVGFKLCVGHPWEFLGIVKAMVETQILPDFIVVDGKEGGTGAAPLEFMDHLGMPLRDGLDFVHNALVGAGLRGAIRIGASGKIVSAFDIARAMALGADWCNSARGFMFAVGCIQSQSCHTDRCPVGVATQDPIRGRALDVADKRRRVANFHASTLHALAELTGAAGLDHPNRFAPAHFSRRVSAHEALGFDELYPPLAPGELLAGSDDRRFRDAWAQARADAFHL
ncbi:MAG: FMN-binding glutamate synthase family protein [Hyphomicrobiales bacterium]|nr:FMN-binding glutamate synthase family protein [Hyphomicrobiales bacterium]